MHKKPTSTTWIYAIAFKRRIWRHRSPYAPWCSAFSSPNTGSNQLTKKEEKRVAAHLD